MKLPMVVGALALVAGCGTASGAHPSVATAPVGPGTRLTAAVALPGRDRLAPPPVTATPRVPQAAAVALAQAPAAERRRPVAVKLALATLGPPSAASMRDRLVWAVFWSCAATRSTPACFSWTLVDATTGQRIGAGAQGGMTLG